MGGSGCGDGATVAGRLHGRGNDALRAPKPRFQAQCHCEARKFWCQFGDTLQQNAAAEGKSVTNRPAKCCCQL